MRLSLKFRRLSTLPGAPGRSFWCPGATSGTLWGLLGRSRDAPRRSRDAPGTASGRSWVPMAFQAGSIGPQTTHLARFWTDFAVDFRCFSRVWLTPLPRKAVPPGRKTWAIAWAASSEPHRPGRIVLAESPWPHSPDFIALALSPWPHRYRASLRAGQVSSFPAALSSPSGQVDLAKYRASLPRSAHNDTISKKND